MNFRSIFYLRQLWQDFQSHQRLFSLSQNLQHKFNIFQFLINPEVILFKVELFCSHLKKNQWWRAGGCLEGGWLLGGRVPPISVIFKNQSVITQFFQSLVPPALIIFTPFSQLFSEPPSCSCLPNLCSKALCYPNILSCIIFHLSMVDFLRDSLLEKTGLLSHNS